MSTIFATSRFFGIILTGLIITSCSGGTSSNTGSGGTSSNTGSGGTSSNTGNCQFPDDIAADGSRCGNRAASVRPGGN